MLPETVQAVELGRRFAQGALDDAGYRGRYEDIMLIVSELVTNVLRHGIGAPRLAIQCSADGTRVRMEVADDSPVLPARRASGPDGGFGLIVVGRLGDWGAQPCGIGKTVWCEVETADAVDDPGLPESPPAERSADRAPESKMAVSP